ncbi:MAG: NAD(+) synthase [Elusimicrobiota bacterium]|nr:NAD(+) synthase [Elusimicrobiota bacterium]
MEKIYKKLIEWIKQQVKQAKKNGVVFGLSGGVDSSVVAVLCKKAFPKNHLALILPCFSSEKDLEDAYTIVKKFNLNSKLVDLKDVFLKFCEILNLEPQSKELSVINIKPRLRMITLYYFANKLNYLVVGTGNKSELIMGYFTKYGDGGVDILPLGDLTKTQVRSLAEFLEIPKNIIDKPPSAGLWEGQTDECEMGITYKELDKIINYIETKKRPIDFNKKIYNKVILTKQKNQHKLFPPKIFMTKF